MVFAIERCPLLLSAIERFFYETMTVIPSVLMNSICYREVSSIKHVRFRVSTVYVLQMENLDRKLESDDEINK